MNDDDTFESAFGSQTARKERWMAPRSLHRGAYNSHAPNWGADASPAGANGNGSGNFDFMPLGLAVLKQWYWILISALILGGAGAYFAIQLWKPKFTATAELMRFDTPNNTELYKPRQLNERTFADMIQAPELLDAVASKMPNVGTARQLLRTLVVSPARDSDKVPVSITASTPSEATEMVNLYATEASKHTRQIQVKEATDASAALKDQLAKVDKEIESVNAQLQAHTRTVVKPAQRNDQLTAKLETEQTELLNLLVKYTELHPLVVQQRAKVSALEKQLKASEAVAPAPNVAREPGKGGSVGLAEADADTEMLRSHLQALANSRVTIVSRDREAQLFVKNPPGYCRVFAEATTKSVTEAKRLPKVAFLAFVGAMVGAAFSLILILLFELLDSKVKTRADAKRVTHLPVVASLGNLKKMSTASQAQWAFRTWVSLQGKLRSSGNRGFVCGITSSAPGEGRSTWVNLLSQAASDCGYRVLTITASRNEAPMPVNGRHSRNGHAQEEYKPETPEEAAALALTTSVLNTPAQVTERLTGENAQPMVHIPLPGWVWNLERRKQWQTALNQWKNIENVVIMVELPPASEPEAVLLAEKLPNLLWLADSGSSDASDIREQLETLRHAHCNLVGTILNRDAAPPCRKRFAKWVPAVVVGLSLLSLLPASGQDQPQLPVPTVAPAVLPILQTNGGFSALNPNRRADWQKKLTLGPGDMLNFAFFSQPELSRTEVMIGPDGQVSYLQAQNILATGFTIDELRDKFDQVLSNYYRAPRVIITPYAYNSKKYYVLGKVINKGVYTLDRPVTIVEAVARAHGFENGTIDNLNSVDLVDLQRSFVMRQGKHLPVNLEKLFQEGDLAQNVPLEPNDYLYFASGALKEVYVLGEVNVPGPLTWTPNTSVMSAITIRGGYNQRAYKSKVLVIRGSLNKPQTFVIDTWATLDGRATDFKLEPKDIVFVGHRPFIRAEELLDLAATAFIQSSVSAWTFQNVPRIFTKPFFPNL